MCNQNHKKYDFMSKLIIVGDSAVGKTNMLLRFTQDQYKMYHVSTIGVDFKIKIMDIQGKKIKFTLWDTAGQDRFRTITTNYYKGSDGVLFTYSISDRQSFMNIQSWVQSVKQRTQKDTCYMIVANKCDVPEQQRQVTFLQGKILADKLNVPFMEVSAKENINIQKLFTSFGKIVKNKIEKKQKQDQSTNVTISINKKIGSSTNKKKCC